MLSFSQTRSMTLVGLVFLLVSLFVSKALAQEEPPPGPAPDAEIEPLRESVRAQIQEIRLQKIREILGVDDAVLSELDRLLRAHDVRVHAARRAQRLAVRALRDALSAPSTPDEQTLSALVLNVTQARTQLHDAERQLMEDIRPLLSPKQQAELILFLPAFERHVRGLIRAARRGNGGPPPHKGPPPHRRHRPNP